MSARRSSTGSTLLHPYARQSPVACLPRVPQTLASDLYAEYAHQSRLNAVSVRLLSSNGSRLQPAGDALGFRSCRMLSVVVHPTTQSRHDCAGSFPLVEKIILQAATGNARQQ